MASFTASQHLLMLIVECVYCLYTISGDDITNPSARKSKSAWEKLQDAYGEDFSFEDLLYYSGLVWQTHYNDDYHPDIPSPDPKDREDDAVSVAESAASGYRGVSDGGQHASSLLLDALTAGRNL